MSVAIHPEELGRQRMVQHLYRPAPVGAVPARRVTAQNILLRGVVKDFNFRREAMHFRNRFVDRRGGCRGVIVSRGMPNYSSSSPLVAGSWSSSLSCLTPRSCRRPRKNLRRGGCDRTIRIGPWSLSPTLNLSSFVSCSRSTAQFDNQMDILCGHFAHCYDGVDRSFRITRILLSTSMTAQFEKRVGGDR